MLRLVLRPLLVILTLGMLLVALFQVTGRIAVVLLDDLELAVNQVLSARGIRVSGLSGDWRMLNPVVRVERVELPAGYLEGLVLEVDMVETVLRGMPLARRLKVAEFRIDLEKRPGEPWRPVGAAEPVDVDPLPFLRHSNQLELTGGVRFLREGHDPARIDVDYLGLNRGGEHRHRLALTNAVGDCAADGAGCRLEVGYHGRQGLWPLRPARDRVTASSAGFRLPRGLLGISPLQVAQLDASWQYDDGDSGGRLELRLEQFDMPGDVTLALQLAGAVRGEGGRHQGTISELRVEQGDDVWELPDVAVRGNAGAVSLWMPSLDLERAGAFVGQALAAVGPVERWLDALAVRGSAHNLRLSYGFDGSGLAYAMTLDGLGIDGYKGVPSVRQASGELLGYGRGLQFNANAQNMDLAFPDIFTGTWRLPYAQGAVQAWFGSDYFGIRGLNLRAEALGARAAGGFAMSRPPDREGQRLLLLVTTDRIGVAQAQQFVPYKLPQRLQDWLLDAPEGGVMEDARLAYQGQFQEEPGELARRLELAARVADARIRYLDDWPVVTDLTGDLAIAGSEVEFRVDGAASGGARLAGSRVRVLDNAAVVNVSLDADTQGDEALEFVRTTPLNRWLAFVEPDWQAAGPLRLSGELNIPLNDPSRELAVRLRADLEGLDLELPAYRVALEALEGSFRYRYPYFVDAAGVDGRLFGEPVTVYARTDADVSDADSDRVHLEFSGRGRPADVWRIVDMADPGVAAGTVDFRADLGVAVTEGVPTTLTVTSTLEGLRLDLPAGLGKTERQSVPAEVRLAFRPELVALDFDYRDAAGWLHLAEAPLRGAIGFDAPPAPESAVSDELVLGGRLDGFALESVLPGEDAQGALTLPIRLRDLTVDEIGVGDFAVANVTVNGRIDRDGFDLDVAGDEVVGRLAMAGDAPLEAELAEVNVPVEDGDGNGDPLSPALIAELPAADVMIDRLRLGDEDYGSWRFDLRPRGSNLLVRNLQASVRGVEIVASDDLVWRGAEGETRFQGELSVTDLADVLPRWGYAPSVETDSASLAGDFAWNGSPAAVDLLKLRGTARARAEDGRFLDVESGAGAQRIFSLLNFTAIAKRMSFNFGDVFGRGISFDELSAEFALDEGLLEFVEPMEVEGTGSSFRVTGSVNLEQGRLDNEMIVTLPVSKSLPWYAAYVALANPLAGVGLLVGERVLRKPLEQFSSARYRIGGTLENPDVELVSVFDVTTPEAESADEVPAPEAATAGAPAAAPTQRSDDESEND